MIVHLCFVLEYNCQINKLTTGYNIFYKLLGWYFHLITFHYNQHLFSKKSLCIQGYFVQTVWSIVVHTTGLLCPNQQGSDVWRPALMIQECWSDPDKNIWGRKKMPKANSLWRPSLEAWANATLRFATALLNMVIDHHNLATVWSLGPQPVKWSLLTENR